MKTLRLITLLTVVCFSLNSLAADPAAPSTAATPPATPPTTGGGMSLSELMLLQSINNTGKTPCDEAWQKYTDDINASKKDVRDQQNQLADKQKQAQSDQKSAWDDVTQDQKDIAQAGTDFHKDQADAQKQTLQNTQQAQQDQNKIQSDLTSTQNSLPIAQTALTQAQASLNTAQLTFDANYIRLQCISELQSKYPKATSARGSNSSIGGEIQWINQTWDQCVKTQEAQVQLTIEKLEAQVTSAQVQLTNANSQIQQDKTALQQAQTAAQQQKAQDTAAQNQAQQDYNSKVQSMQSKMQLDQQNAQQVAMQSQQALASEKQAASTSAYDLDGDIAALSGLHKTGNICGPKEDPQAQMARCCVDKNFGDADGDGDTPTPSSDKNETGGKDAKAAPVSCLVSDPEAKVCPQASLTDSRSSASDGIDSFLNSLSTSAGRSPSSQMNGPGAFSLYGPQ
jgi:hypothetical protein